jgi:hypothetical protein
MKTGTYRMSYPNADLLLHVSTTSATLLQVTRWNEVWSKLLGDGSAAPAVSGTTLTVVRTSGEVVSGGSAPAATATRS